MQASCHPVEMTIHALPVALSGIDPLDGDVQIQAVQRSVGLTIMGPLAAAKGLLAALMVMLCPISGAAADLLPLKRGFYVDDSVPCGQASNATLMLFTGTSFGANCVVKSVRKAGRSTRITQTCTIRDDEADWTFLYTVLNAREFLLRNDQREFHFRYCDLQELPSPWSSTDLSDLMDKTP